MRHETLKENHAKAVQTVGIIRYWKERLSELWRGGNDTTDGEG